MQNVAGHGGVCVGYPAVQVNDGGCRGLVSALIATDRDSIRSRDTHTQRPALLTDHSLVLDGSASIPRKEELFPSTVRVATGSLLHRSTGVQ